MTTPMPPTSVDAVLRKLYEDNDPFRYGLVGSLAETEAEIHKHGWDQHPCLWRAFRQMLDPQKLREAGIQLPDGQVPEDGFILGFNPVVEGADLGSNGPDFAARMHGLAAYLRTSAAPLGDTDTIGWLLTNEAWMLMSKDFDTDKGVDPSEMDNARVSAHPQRVEVRMLLLIERGGSLIQMIRRRDTDELMVSIAEGTPESWQLIGNLPAALSDLMEATP